MLKPSLSELVLLALFLAASSVFGVAADPADGTLQISYAFSTAQGLEPSYQIAIWLRRRTASSSNHCSSANISPTAASTIRPSAPTGPRSPDGTRRPKPNTTRSASRRLQSGSNTLNVDCKARGICRVHTSIASEVHIVENFNILYKGKIAIGGPAAEDTAVATYIPSKNESAANVINSVSAKYMPGGAAAAEERKP